MAIMIAIYIHWSERVANMYWEQGRISDKISRRRFISWDIGIIALEGRMWLLIMSSEHGHRRRRRRLS